MVQLSNLAVFCLQRGPAYRQTCEYRAAFPVWRRSRGLRHVTTTTQSAPTSCTTTPRTMTSDGKVPAQPQFAVAFCNSHLLLLL